MHLPHSRHWQSGQHSQIGYKIILVNFTAQIQKNKYNNICDAIKQNESELKKYKNLVIILLLYGTFLGLHFVENLIEIEQYGSMA